MTSYKFIVTRFHGMFYRRIGKCIQYMPSFVVAALLNGSGGVFDNFEGFQEMHARTIELSPPESIYTRKLSEFD